MIALQEHIDALDKMVVDHASLADIRSQIAFVGREVAALEADYARLLQAHTNLQQAHTTLEAAHEKLVAEHPELRERIRALEATVPKERREDAVDKMALPILKALMHEDGGVTLEELAQSTGYIPSMAHHYCEELEGIGFVERIRFRGDQRRVEGPDWGFSLAKKGRKWIAQQLA